MSFTTPKPIDLGKRDRRGKARALLPGQLDELCQACTPEYATLFWLAYHTGSRISEVAQLTNLDFDWEANTVTFPAERSKTSINRVIRVDPGLMRQIQALRRTPRGRVWPKSSSAIDAYLRRRCKALGGEFKGVSTHSFRHSFVKNKMAEGWSVKEVRQVTGHKSMTSFIEYC